MTDAALKELLAIPALPHLDLLHYLLSESEGKHVAHCLDLDLVAAGEDRKAAAAKLDRLVKAHIELALASGQLANLSTKAPNKFWDQFAVGKPVKLDPATLRIRIPESVQIVPVSGSELKILAHAA
jgi:hypothetical protein